MYHNIFHMEICDNGKNVDNQEIITLSREREGNGQLTYVRR